MNNTIKKWAQSKIGSKFEWGKNDCNMISIEFLSLTTLKSVPRELARLVGAYKCGSVASYLAKSVDYDEGFSLFDYKSVDDSPKEGDVLLVDLPKVHYKLMLPVIYGKTVLCSIDDRICLKSIDELDYQYKIYRRAA